MNWFHKRRQLRVISRNEGKLKSYDSCDDVRAWSHDTEKRDRYLREWIKADMPTSVIPMNIVLQYFQGMTYGNRHRGAPRCHPDCKSKIVLDSLNSTCQAMRECLKTDQGLENLFVEEDIETSHWPCDMTLEALKNIKLFWRVLLQKIFSVNITKTNLHNSDRSTNCRPDSVLKIAKKWEKDMLQQAMFFKVLSPELSRTSVNIPKATSNCGDIKRNCERKCSCKIRKTLKHGTGASKSYSNLKDIKTRKCCRCCSVRVKTADVSCQCVEKKDSKTERLEKEELEKLKNENTLLKNELKKVYESCRSTFLSSYDPQGDKQQSRLKVVPKPMKDTCITKNYPAKDADSEMIITLKNCKDPSFRHVSLLQVLHKTNRPIVQEVLPEGPCLKKEDPLCILSKVQEALGELVQREVSLASNKSTSTCRKKIDIDASSTHF